jgi:hypothetical protein
LNVKLKGREMLFKLFQLFLLASLKYILTVPYVLLIELEYKYVLPTIVIGGIGGFLFFYFLSKKVMGLFRKLIPLIHRFMSERVKSKYGKIFVSWFRPRHKPIFSVRNRMIIRVKKSYGLWGIVIATPVLLSIPVGAFIASHYYSKDRRVVGYMLLSITGWGIIFSSLMLLFPGIYS